MKTLITIAAVFLFVTPTIGCTDSTGITCTEDFYVCHGDCPFLGETFTNKSECLEYRQCADMCSDVENECLGPDPDSMNLIKYVDCDNVPE